MNLFCVLYLKKKNAVINPRFIYLFPSSSHNALICVLLLLLLFFTKTKFANLTSSQGSTLKQRQKQFKRNNNNCILLRAHKFTKCRNSFLNQLFCVIYTHEWFYHCLHVLDYTHTHYKSMLVPKKMSVILFFFCGRHF